MNLVLGYEMGEALLKSNCTAECWTQALAKAPQSAGPQLYRNVERVEKGTFPQQLGKLRGQLSLNASGDEPVAVVLECPAGVVLTLVANDVAGFYGIWNVGEAKFYSLKAEEMYGTHLTTLIKQMCTDNSGEGLWVAYFLGTQSPPPPPPSPAPPAAQEPVVKKKTVVRKRPALSMPTIEVAAAEEPVAKKAVPPPLKEKEEQEESPK